MWMNGHHSFICVSPKLLPEGFSFSGTERHKHFSMTNPRLQKVRSMKISRRQKKLGGPATMLQNVVKSPQKRAQAAKDIGIECLKSMQGDFVYNYLTPLLMENYCQLH